MDLLRFMNRERVVVILPLIVGVVTAFVLFGIEEPIYSADGIVGYKAAIDPHIVIIYAVMAFIMSTAIANLVYWLIDRCQVLCLQTS
ncbi:MAG: hypothetical protein EP297_10070 [Gammaproteobacteria bacterium]|nr:MAG: hypothetical protein EP297_10070 [Gammaproteobacteria bacterium]